MKQAIEQKLDVFFSQFPTVNFKKGQTVIYASDTITAIYYLKKGFVRQSFITEEGEEITHHIFKPVSYFPIMLALSTIQNRYTFTAMDDLAIQKAPAEQVISFLKQEPDVLFELTTRLSEGLNKLLLRNEQLLFKDAYEKVVSLLVYLAQRFGEKHGETIAISLPATHTDLSSWLGMQRETVSRQIEKLQKKGLITYEKQLITIRDMQRLTQETTKTSASDIYHKASLSDTV